MEEEFRKLSVKVAEIETKISTWMKAACLIGLIIIGWMGYNSFFAIPKEVGKQIEISAIGEVDSKISELLASSKEKASSINALIEDLKIGKIDLYQCPSDETAKLGGAWLSIGCVGQISSEPQCANIVWVGKPHYTRLDCTPLRLMSSK